MYVCLHVTNKETDKVHDRVTGLANRTKAHAEIEFLIAIDVL